VKWNFDPRTSAFLGIALDLSLDRLNANDSVRVNREFDSNKIDEKD
jgi:hypothetical protein